MNFDASISQAAAQTVVPNLKQVAARKNELSPRHIFPGCPSGPTGIDVLTDPPRSKHWRWHAWNSLRRGWPRLPSEMPARATFSLATTMKSATKSAKAGRDRKPSVEPEQIEEMFRLLIENVKDYAILLLDPEGKVLTWSAAAQRLKGWQADEIIGQHFSVFYPREDVERGKTVRELRIAEEEGRFEDEGWRVRKDGTRFWANVIVTALRDKQGKLAGFGKVTRDLTERREAEEKIKRQAQEIFEMAAVPVVQVWDGIALVPLIGTLDSQRTQQLMERLLHRITETNSPVALVDITGVPTIDSQTAHHLIETIAAVRLLGADVVLTGVRPAIAQTLVHLGIDLSNVITRSSLTAGLRMALDILNLKVTPKADNAIAVTP
jgi:PAS domain S-box-containing protein